MLKKEFKTKDVNRVRNLLTKKYGNSVTTQVGYTKSSTKHEEGDIWEENGKTWTIKNGIKITVTKLDQLKNQYMIPILCPSCGNKMNHRNDIKMYYIHSMCMECVTKMETKLRKEGKYEEYASNIVRANALSIIEEAKAIAIDSSKESTSFVTENGDIEEWVGNSSKIKEEISTFIEHLDKIKQDIQSIKKD